MLNQSVTLSNGVSMPILGFGTFKVSDAQECVNSVKNALACGYRHIDTAAIYGNEEAVGQGLIESGVPREEIFLVSKVWNSDQGYENTLKAFQTSLDKLKTDYLDLYLIHWPKPLNAETWKALEELYTAGKIRAIGVSNFQIHHLEELFKTATIKPMVNQVEYHPQLAQDELHAFCKAHNIQLEGWGPLMQGQIFSIPLMQELATKYNKSIAQIALRWHIQKEVVAIPKSVSMERIKGNSDIFDFEISAEDMATLATLNTGERIGPDPDNFDF